MALLQNWEEYEQQKEIRHEKKQLMSQTPVLSGFMRANAPPETPSIYTDKQAVKIPVYRRFNVRKPEFSGQQNGIYNTFYKLVTDGHEDPDLPTQRKG